MRVEWGEDPQNQYSENGMVTYLYFNNRTPNKVFFIKDAAQLHSPAGDTVQLHSPPWDTVQLHSSAGVTITSFLRACQHETLTFKYEVEYLE